MHQWTMLPLVASVLPFLKSTVSMNYVTHNVAVVSWKKWNSKGDGGQGAVVAYRVSHRPQGETRWTDSPSIDDTADMVHTIQALRPNTLYEVGVRVSRVGPGGMGAVSGLTQIKTKCAGISICSLRYCDVFDTHI